MTQPLWGGWIGTPVLLSAELQDGKVLYGVDPAHNGGSTNAVIMIGTRPWTLVERAGAEGRYIVRRGMADVLEWIGEEVGPAPVFEGRGRALYDSLREAQPRTSLRVPDFPS